MTKIGAVMWEMLSEPLTFSQLQQALLKRFEVNEDQCKKDISEFLSDLHKQGLLHISRKE
jgi:DNA-directed RNA polymerase delta subunit